MGLGPMEFAVILFIGLMVGGPIVLLMWLVGWMRSAAADRRELLDRLARLEAKLEQVSPPAAR